MHIKKVYGVNRRKTLQKLFFELFKSAKTPGVIADSEEFIANLLAMSDKNRDKLLDHLYDFLDQTRELWDEDSVASKTDNN